MIIGEIRRRAPATSTWSGRLRALGLSDPVALPLEANATSSGEETAVEDGRLDRVSVTPGTDSDERGVRFRPTRRASQRTSDYP